MEHISVHIFWVSLPPLTLNFHLLADVHACWQLKCLQCRMGHYNSTHAVLEEKKHDFEIALLQVRNVKPSSYFRWQWEPELFLTIPTQLTSIEGKWNLCSQVFARSCMRPLTACLLQRAALQSPVLPLNASFQDLLFWTYFPAAVFATDDSMGNHLLCILPESIPSSQNNCTIETPQAETAQLKRDGITTMHYIPQTMKTVVWWILLQVPTTPHRRGQCLNKLIPLFQYIYSKQSFFALRFTCVLKRERLWKSCRVCCQSQYPTVDHLACWFQKTEGKPRKAK